MQLTIAAAAFNPRGAKALDNARAAGRVAAEQGADLLLLPGLSWKRRDIAQLSREGLAVCAACADEGGVLFKGGEALLMQPPLYGDGARGEDVAMTALNGVQVAVLPGDYMPQAARLAALYGAQLLLCPVELADERIAAGARDNGCFAAVAPSSGEARVIGPPSAEHPDGTLARGRPGTMAVASVSLVDWARAKLQFDALAGLNRPFAAAIPQAEASGPPAAPIGVGAVRREYDFAGGKKALIARMEALCAQAKEAGCSLILFPEYNWLDAMGFPLGALGRRLSARAGEGGAQAEEAHRISIAEAAALRFSAGGLYRLARRESARLAQKYGLAVCGGTCIEKRRGKLYNTAVIALPGGEVLAQRKLHPSREERGIGVLPGDELIAFEVGGALCCAPVGEDALYYEPFVAARRMGCDVAAVASAQGATVAEQRERLAARAREACLYVANAAMVGAALGRRLAGEAGVFDPQGEPMERAQAPSGDALAVAFLDFDRLRQLQSLRPAPNRALEERMRSYLLAESRADGGRRTGASGGPLS